MAYHYYYLYPDIQDPNEESAFVFAMAILGTCIGTAVITGICFMTMILLFCKVQIKCKEQSRTYETNPQPVYEEINTNSIMATEIIHFSPNNAYSVNKTEGN